MLLKELEDEQHEGGRVNVIKATSFVSDGSGSGSGSGSGTVTVTSTAIGGSGTVQHHHVDHHVDTMLISTTSVKAAEKETTPAASEASEASEAETTTNGSIAVARTNMKSVSSNSGSSDSIFTAPCIDSCRVSELERQQVILERLHHGCSFSSANSTTSDKNPVPDANVNTNTSANANVEVDTTMDTDTATNSNSTATTLPCANGTTAATATASASTAKKNMGCELADKCVSSCAAYGRVCPCAARIAAHEVVKSIRQLMENSRIFVVPPCGTISSSTTSDTTAAVPKMTDIATHTITDCSSTSPVPVPVPVPATNTTGAPQCLGFPFLNADDIIIEEKLGEGGFSNVNACSIKRRAQPQDEQDDLDDHQQQQQKETVDEAPVEEEDNEQQQQIQTTKVKEPQLYAIKYLKKRSMVDLHQFKHGAADLAVEAFFLHRLSHPHIIKLHGVTAGSVETAVAAGKECGYFIVIDRLSQSLEQRIETWHNELHEMNHSSSNTGILARLILPSTETKIKKKQHLYHRLKVAKNIASAMEYIHSLNIVYRDLKPDNIGFDYNGDTVKIFDFGLAKELKKQYQRSDDGRYQLTGNTGSRRYMSPEVAQDMPYNQSVDVYSFGIMLWEMCTTEKPFQGYSANRHMQNVVLNNERPKMDHSHTGSWPPNLTWLLKHCWSQHPAARPNFTMILEVLDDILNDRFIVPKSLVPTRVSNSGSSTVANHQRRHSSGADFSNVIHKDNNYRKSTDATKARADIAAALECTATATATATPSCANSVLGESSLSPLSPTPPKKFPKMPTKGIGGRARTWGFPNTGTPSPSAKKLQHL